MERKLKNAWKFSPLIILIVFVLGSYFWYNGTPWGNYHDRKLIIESLNEKYSSDSYTVIRGGYDLKKGEYGLAVIFKTDPSIEHIYVVRNKELVEAAKGPSHPTK